MKSILNILLIVDMLILVLGLIRPAYVLWFLDVKNRIRVLQYTGIVLLMLIILRVALTFFSLR